MNTKPRSPIALLLLGTFLLACAGTASARDIVIEYVTVTLSSLNSPTALNGGDTITVKNNGTLWVDANVEIGKLSVGDTGAGATAGTVLFANTTTVLTVTNDVVFGDNAGNTLDMAYLTPTTPHVLKVGGNFLASGAGAFKAGSATIEYTKAGAQNVTARIGGTGAVIQYKHLTLSGSPAATTALKTFGAGVSVQGTLAIEGKAALAGPSVSYGSLAALLYNGSIPQTTTTTEWPTTGLNVPVVIKTGGGVTLDGDKSIGAAGFYSLSIEAGGLNDNGKTLTVQGNINNAISIVGTGKLVLNGTAAQTLAGIGSYGNVSVNNPLGVALPGSSIMINGRLTIAAGGKVTLPNGVTHHTALLTLGGNDKAAGNYGSIISNVTPAGNQSDVAFDANTTGILTVDAKPAGVITASSSSASIVYGANSVTVTGTVTNPATVPNFGVYGNTAITGEVVTVTITPSTGPALVKSTGVTNGAFSVTLNTVGTLPAGGPHPVRIDYSGGINLASSTLTTPAGLTVTKLIVFVTPKNVTNFFGDPEPSPLEYDFTPALVSGDSFVGALTRDTSSANPTFAGEYLIQQGTLALSDNYQLNFDASKKLVIKKKPITVTPIAGRSKTFGTAVDPELTYTLTPALLGTDVVTPGTKLARAAGENAYTYRINLGNLSAGPNYDLTLSTTPVNFTINPLPINVTFANATKVYGEADPTLAIQSITPALIGTDAFTGAPSRATPTIQSVGEYEIGKGTLALADATNYLASYNAGAKLTITPRPVIVSAVNKSIEYGQPIALPGDFVAYEAVTAGRGLITANQNGVTGKAALDTKPTLTNAVPPTQFSPPGDYAFKIATAGADANYAPVIATAPANMGTLTITKPFVTITAVNKTKVADGTTFVGFTVTYSGFLTNGDSEFNSFVDLAALKFGGHATNATAAGVYVIAPYGLTSTKYQIKFVNGWLSLTAPSGTTATNGPIVWSGVTGKTNHTFTLSKADGTVGTATGWSLLNITGTLDIEATSSDKFRIDLLTLAGNAAGLAQKFDPTRPYSWEFVRASAGITGFSQDKFLLNYTNLFANPTFQGQFSVRQDVNSLYIDFTPVGTAPVAIPSGYTVGTVGDTATLLGNVTHSDVPALYLQPSAYGLTPQQPVTINLNIANLGANQIVGVDAFINFDSRIFTATATGPGSPVVQAGGGVWDTVVYKSWNVGGDLDTVIAVNLTSAGTSADGTVAKITLTPTRTATGKSRVVFRKDGGLKADGTGPLTTDIISAEGVALLPARVMTDEITVIVDNSGPVINANAITATQVQPHVATPVDVKNNVAAAIRTSGGISDSTASGPVIITIPVEDAGVGLSGAPILYMTNGVGNGITILPSTTGNVGPFIYQWAIPATILNGSWTGVVIAADTILPTPFTTVNVNAFTIKVNTTEITGVVELQSFKGTNRVVTFKTGDTIGTPTNTWNLNLNFTSGALLNAGAFQNRSNFAWRVTHPTDPLSTYLRYGTILNLPALVSSLVNEQGGVSAYLHQLLYGEVTSLSQLAATLTSPARAVDVYIVGRLAPATIVALGAYQSAPSSPAAAQAFRAAILNDFNNIALGVNIYEPVRFASAGLTPATVAAATQVPQPTGAALVEVNRSLLEDAYATGKGGYVSGQLEAATAQQLSLYSGGANATLEGSLLRMFDTLTVTSSLWPSVAPKASLYKESIFLGVTLSPETLALYNSIVFPTGDLLTLLNQHLLEDAYAGLFERAPLQPATVAAALAYNPEVAGTAATFDGWIVADLNALVTGGTTIYTAARFAPWIGGVEPDTELGQLLASASPTPAQQIRENRLLLELGYPELSPSILATYRLVDVPAGMTEVSAKTAWNLRVHANVTFDQNMRDATANFVSDGVPSWTAQDTYLRGGDLNGDNAVNLIDYNLLRVNFGFGPTANRSAADINGDGFGGLADYSLLQLNWAKSGGAEVK